MITSKIAHILHRCKSGPYRCFTQAMEAGKRDRRCQKAGELHLIKSDAGFFYSTRGAGRSETEILSYHYVADIAWSYPVLRKEKEV
jgi:hypothetical protein